MARPLAYVDPPHLSKKELKAVTEAVRASAAPLTNLALFLIAAEWNVGH